MGEKALSRTRKLLTQITQVCREICDIKGIYYSKKNHIPLDTDCTNKGLLPNKSGKGEMGCTRSTGNKKHARCEDLYNNPHSQTRHASLVPPSILPPSFPSPTSSHSSSEVSASESSASCDGPPSCSMGGSIGETMALSSSQKETNESLEEQDSRGGGLTCPDETSEWRSLNKVGIGDCQKSPKMGHSQHELGLEL